ncbi:DUF1036 domain-containing protein [Nakamurella sp. PAMC28650]|jgi:hypothetical protein|uniref:DUF1036 domain-containing protein n=1 Tax=Nakamurella sp. PAMC28650 TaxID=2762325 RepID=UPI002107BCFE|nr:DUF1036 domain-containing protein [Nakamurella sp. PAMC28650]
MQLCFQNNYSSPLSVAVMWWNPDGCGDYGNWGTRGWWNLNPGETVHTDVWTANRYFYFYAEAWDGGVWSGPYGAQVPYESFDSCAGIGSTADHVVGMREVDAGWWFWSYATYTVGLS